MISALFATVLLRHEQNLCLAEPAGELPRGMAVMTELCGCDALTRKR